MKRPCPSPETIRYCLKPHVDPISSRHFQLTRERWVKSTLRQVYTDHVTKVVKCFFQYPGKREFHKPWVREDKALRTLGGANAPTSYGYVKIRTPEGIPAVIYTKAYIRGNPPVKIDPETAAAMGRLLAGFHDRGVVTLDPSLSNFIRMDDGRLAFIDFGRARVYRYRGPLFRWMVGKEFFRIYRESFFCNPDLLETFKRAYYTQRTTMKPRDARSFDKSFHHWKKRHKRRHGELLPPSLPSGSAP